MKFTIGGQTVTPRNDGGIGILYNSGEGFKNWQPGGFRPVLSLEVSRATMVINIRQNAENRERGTILI